MVASGADWHEGIDFDFQGCIARKLVLLETNVNVKNVLQGIGIKQVVKDQYDIRMKLCSQFLSRRWYSP